MEAIPRLPMLSFDLKRSPEFIEFGPVLKQYIKTHYEEDATVYNKACSELEQLRQDTTQVVCDYMGCTTLKKYFAQLQYLQGRFPMCEGEEAAIAFTWEDVQTGRDHIGDIKFEQASILYNIGSLHSLLGVLDTRHNAEGMKVSCTHFQCAAWAFEYLRDNFGNSSISTDMSFELLSFHILLMLAQAQECILEKSMLDGRKNSITAKVAAQVVEFYRQAIKAIDTSSQLQQINSRMHKEWRRRMEMKEAFYLCITFYYQGQQVAEAEKPGECLAYFTGARDKLAEAIKLAKNEVPEVSECLQRCQEIVVARYNSAKKDNDFVYHEKVPTLDSLPEIKGASLVKGIPFNPTDKEISGPDIFHKLVPMETHEASSIYSEEKAKLARVVNGEIDEKDMELNQFLSSLQLDMDQFTPKVDTIPEKLMEKCAAMSVRINAIKELTDSMAGVSGLATEVELAINEIQELIDEDTTKTEQFEEQYGRKKPNTVLPGLLKDLLCFREQHIEATQLNTTLYRAMNTHTNNLKTLILPPLEVEKHLPRSTPELNPNEEAILNEIINLLRKVNIMRDQRKELQDKFREQIHTDDITNVLVTHETKNRDTVFSEQLKKHDDTVKFLRQNMTAQDNILRALTDSNAKFAVIRKTFDEAKERRQSKVNDLILSYDKYEDLLAKSQRGEEYNRKLLEKVTKTLERCRSECKVRQEERNMLVAHYAPKAAAPSRPLAPKPGTSSIPNTPTGDTSAPNLTMPSQMPYVNPTASAIPEAADPLMPTAFQNLPTAFEGPKLKDYLPFMKPHSFGPKAQSSTPDSSIPPSPGAPPESPQPSMDFPDPMKGSFIPGLDPSLSSILPATIAQYLASHSPSSSSSPMSSARHTPSPQQSGTIQYPGYSGVNLEHGLPRVPSPSQSPHSSPSRQRTSQMNQYNPYASVTPGSIPPNMVTPSNPQLPRPQVSACPVNVKQTLSPIIPGSVVATTQYTNPQPLLCDTQAMNSGQYKPNQQPSFPAHASSFVPTSHGLTTTTGQSPPRLTSHPHPDDHMSNQQPSQPHPFPQQPTQQPQQQPHLYTNAPVVPSGLSQQPQSIQPQPTNRALQQQKQQFSQPQVQPQMNPQWTASVSFSTGTVYATSTQPQIQAVGGATTQLYQAQLPAQDQRLSYQKGHSQPYPQKPHSQAEQAIQHHGYPVHQGQLQGPYAQHQSHSVPQRQSHDPHNPQGHFKQTHAQQFLGQSQSTSTVTPIPQQLPQQSHPKQYPAQAGHWHGSPGQLQHQGQRMQPPVRQPPYPQGQAITPQIYGQPVQTQGYPVQPGGQSLQPYDQPAPIQPQGQPAPMQPQGQPAPIQPQGQPAPIQPQGHYPVAGPSADITSFNAQRMTAPTKSPYGSPQKNTVNLRPTGSVLSQSATPVTSSHSSFQQPAQGHMPPSVGNNQTGSSNMVPPTGQVQGYRTQQTMPFSNATIISQSSIPEQTSQQVSTYQSNMNQIQSYSQSVVGGQASMNSCTQRPASSQQQPTFTTSGYSSHPQQLPSQQSFGHHTSQVSFPPNNGVSQMSIVRPSHPKELTLSTSSQWAAGPYSQQLSNLPNPTQTLPTQFQHPQQYSQQQPSQNQHSSLTLKALVPSRPNTPASTQISQDNSVSTLPISVSTPPVMVPMSPQPSSLDELLSSSPNGVKDRVIAPQVLTDQERQLQKEEAMKNQATMPAAEPYSAQGALLRLVADVETFSKHLDNLSLTILGVSRLDSVWKTLLDSQDSQKMSMAIARCYPMKNRDPDIMPYDDTRVVLTTTKDDYINASWLNDLAPSCPKFIITQSPLPVTTVEFWTMVYEQGSEVLVQITSEYETGKKFPLYYPTEKDKAMEQGPMLITLQSVKFRLNWVERILYMKNTVTKQGRTVVHLLFKGWPVSGFPDDVKNIVSFISEVHSFYKQQRSLTKPIIVHCGTGVGRSGVFVLVYAAIQELLHGNGLVDLRGLAKRILQKRRNILLKKEQLYCAYKALLCFAEDYLDKREMPVKNPRFIKAPSETRDSGKDSHFNQPSYAADDIVFGSLDIETIRENVGRFHISKEKDESKKNILNVDSHISDTSATSPSMSMTSLPDLVQQHSESYTQPIIIEQQCNNINLPGNPDVSLTPATDFPTPSFNSMEILSKTTQHQESLDLLQESTTNVLENAVLEPKDSSTLSNVSASLAQLQDPATFTLGSPEKRNRITKTNFGQEEGALLRKTSPDTSDPLATLDPLWSLGK